MFVVVIKIIFFGKEMTNFQLLGMLGGALMVFASLVVISNELVRRRHD